jgi:hypothetical protein
VRRAHRRSTCAWRTAPSIRTDLICDRDSSPWENGYVESFNARLRDELLNGGVFYTLHEAQIVIESWRRHYNTVRVHASLGYKPPAPEVFGWSRITLCSPLRTFPPASIACLNVSERGVDQPRLHASDSRITLHPEHGRHVTALCGTLWPAVADHGLIHGAAPRFNSATIRVRRSVKLFDCLWHFIQFATKSVSRRYRPIERKQYRQCAFFGGGCDARVA